MFNFDHAVRQGACEGAGEHAGVGRDVGAVGAQHGGQQRDVAGRAEPAGFERHALQSVSVSIGEREHQLRGRDVVVGPQRAHGRADREELRGVPAPPVSVRQQLHPDDALGVKLFRFRLHPKCIAMRLRALVSAS